MSLQEKVKFDVEEKGFPGFEYYSESKKKFIKIPPKLKHILVFGQSRQGKSSLINLMTNKNSNDGATVSDDVKGCSFSTEPWFDNEYCFWDTAGLNEQDNGEIVNTVATMNLIKFVRDSKGFHGAIMVVAWNNLNTATTKRNWDLFYDTFLDKRIPILICITGRGIESADKDQEWANKQVDYIEQLGYISKVGKPLGCVVYSKDISEVSEILQDMYIKLRNQSKAYVKKLLRKNVTNEFYNPIGDGKWYDVFKRMYNTLALFFGLKKWMISVRDGFKDLLIKLGFADDEAQQIAGEAFTK